LVWAVHDGRIGIVNQVLGLAEAVGLPFEEKRILPLRPFSLLPPRFWGRPARATAPGSDPLAPPWPDLLIGAGQFCAAAGIAIKRAAAGRTFLVQIQDPRASHASFDLMVVPAHDPVRGERVVVTRGAVHRVTASRLAEAGKRFAPLVAALPRPLLAVLIGGANRVYRLDDRRLGAVAEEIAALARRSGAGLLVTPSRRTGAAGEQLLRGKLAGTASYIWDGSGENPYFAFLALADAILVTEDSISMVTEAASTGKPVYVIGLEGGSRKFREFHRLMTEAGATRPFTGVLESWRYEPINDTALAAEEIRRRMGMSTLARPAESIASSG
jgi:hypothetical protein